MEEIKDYPSYLDFPKGTDVQKNKEELTPVSKELLERFQIGKKCYEIINLPSGYYKVKELEIIGIVLVNDGKELKVIFPNNAFVFVNNNILDETINIYEGKDLYLDKDKAIKICEESLLKVIEEKKEELKRLENEINNLEL